MNSRFYSQLQAFENDLLEEACSGYEKVIRVRNEVIRRGKSEQRIFPTIIFFKKLFFNIFTKLSVTT